MDFAGHSESAFMNAIASAVTCFMNNMPPKIAVEAARRGLPSDVRPSAEELEAMLKEVDSYTD